MTLNYVVLDAETYWDADYSLTKLTHEQYIRDPRFAVHGWGVHESTTSDVLWLDHEQFCKWIGTVSWKHTAVVCHNTRFDGAILGWHYGLRPAMWLDTVGMYRALHPHLPSHSLGALAKHFGIGDKALFFDALTSTRGKRTLTAPEWEKLGEYCKYDCFLTSKLLDQALPDFPPFERAIMNMTLRMFIEPVFEVDVPLLRQFYKQHIVDKQNALARAGLTKTDVMSSVKFAQALRGLGVEPEMKQSPTNVHKTTFAFAKTDPFMEKLANHENLQVQMLAAARIGSKSTQFETRAKHLIEIGERSNLPIPLNYWGAKVTGRHSGGDNLNAQNFTRGSVLRKAIRAPKGYKIVVGDSSNIELRVVMAAAGQLDQVERIRYYDSIPEEEKTTDLYCDFASHIYGRTITRKDKDERFVGKQGMLSLQYMASAKRFGEMLRMQRRALPAYEVERITSAYRGLHNKIVELWRYCDTDIIPAIFAHEVMRSVDVNGWFLTNHTGFALPGYLGVQYSNMQQDSWSQLASMSGNRSGVQWSYLSGKKRRALYGAKLVENMCQHAARQVVMYQALLVNTKYPVVHTVHDEIVSCVPEEQAQDCADLMLKCLCTAPPWAGGRLPVFGDVGIGDTYGEAK
jgi:DNA polymerase